MRRISRECPLPTLRRRTASPTSRACSRSAPDPSRLSKLTMSEHKISWLAPGARRHVAKMLSALAPRVETLDPTPLLRERGLGADAIAQLALITPAAASRARSLDSFFPQVERSGRELARLRITPEQATAAL